MGSVIQFQDAVTGKEDGENAKRFLRKRTMWQHNLTFSDLTPTERIVGLAISFHANNPDQYAYPGYDYLAEKLGMNRRTVIRAVKELERRNFIKVDQKKGRVNRYWLIENTPIGG
jgi:DNA-binding MarR family transcriptional regulator